MHFVEAWHVYYRHGFVLVVGSFTYGSVGAVFAQFIIELVRSPPSLVLLQKVSGYGAERLSAGFEPWGDLLLDGFAAN